MTPALNVKYATKKVLKSSLQCSTVQSSTELCSLHIFANHFVSCEECGHWVTGTILLLFAEDISSIVIKGPSEGNTDNSGLIYKGCRETTDHIVGPLNKHAVSQYVLFIPTRRSATRLNKAKSKQPTNPVIWTIAKLQSDHYHHYHHYHHRHL